MKWLAKLKAAFAKPPPPVEPPAPAFEHAASLEELDALNIELGRQADEIRARRLLLRQQADALRALRDVKD